jgi:hypothetical protein
MRRICLACEYYCPVEAARGQCRAEPPVVISYPPQASALTGAPGMPAMFGTWPPVQGEGWCGRWVERVGSAPVKIHG